MGKIFGAYTDIGWRNYGDWVNGNGNSFVFSYRDDFNFVKLRYLKKEEEVYHSEGYLCVFGCISSGFCIHNDCNINTDSFSNLGYDG